MTNGDSPASWPPLPNGPYVAGMGAPDSKIHAITHHAALVATRHYDTTGDPHRTATECGTRAFVARARPFLFARGDTEFDRVSYRACTECAWRVAVNTMLLNTELAAQVPPDNDATAMELHGVDPTLVFRLCAAALYQFRFDVGEDTHTTRLLGHLCDHRPVALLSFGCLEQACDHPDEGGCYLESPGIACLACSLSMGDDQGETAGAVAFECQVPALCSVLTTYAVTFHVPLTRKAPDAD